MPTYDFRCKDHGDEERRCLIAERKEQRCSTCGGKMQQILTSAPKLAEEAMAWAGMPGAIMKQGDRMEKQHRSVDQSHRPATK